jgi:hypothetical protein
MFLKARFFEAAVVFSITCSRESKCFSRASLFLGCITWRAAVLR